MGTVALQDDGTGMAETRDLGGSRPPLNGTYDADSSKDKAWKTSTVVTGHRTASMHPFFRSITCIIGMATEQRLPCKNV